MRGNLSLEDMLEMLRNLDLKEKLMPSLDEAGISWGTYAKDPAGTLRKLSRLGIIKYPSVPTNPTIPERERKRIAGLVITREIEILTPGKTLVVPYNTGLFPSAQASYFKKGGVLLSKPLVDLEPSGTSINSSLLPFHQIRPYLDHLDYSDSIVGYRGTGNTDTRYHICMLNDILRGQIVFEHLDPEIVKVTDLSGTGKDPQTLQWQRSKTGATIVFEGIPSFSTEEKAYKLTMVHVPAFPGEPHTREVLQAAFNLASPDHTCEKTRYYHIKRKRFGLSIDSHAREPNASLKATPYEHAEMMLCHHQVLATLCAGRYLAQEIVARDRPRWHLLNPFPQFNQGWETFYMKLLKDVFKERRVYDKKKNQAKIVREPLTVLDTEILLWKRMVYLHQLKQTLHQQGYQSTVPEVPEGWMEEDPRFKYLRKTPPPHRRQ